MSNSRAIKHGAGHGVRAAAVYVLLTIGTSLGCSASVPAGPGPLTPSLEIQLAAPTEPYFPGASISYLVYTVDSEGVYKLVTSGVTWTSSNPGVVRVDATSIPPLRAVGSGVSTVSATFGGLTASIPAYVRSLTTQPEIRFTFGLPLQVGSTSRTVALLTPGFSPGVTQEVTSVAAWTSSNPSVASVDRGIVAAHSVGTVEIRASYNGVSAWYQVSVPPIQ